MANAREPREIWIAIRRVSAHFLVGGSLGGSGACWTDVDSALDALKDLLRSAEEHDPALTLRVPRSR
jgi:hypothetical protein